MRITCTVQHGDRAADVLIACDDATRAADLEAVLRTELGVEAGPAAGDVVGVLTAGRAAAATVADAALHHGDIVRLDGERPPPSLTPAGLQLHVIGGPAAGHVFALPIGSHEVGRAATLSWADTSMSRRHCRIDVGPGGASVTDLGSANGSALDGDLLTAQETRPWPLDQQLEIGDSIVVVRRARTGETVVESAEPGWRNFLRPPRIAPWVRTPEIEIPRAPQAHKPRRFPLLAMLLPIPFAIVMAVVMSTGAGSFRWQYLMFGFMSPMMMAGNYLSDRMGSAKDHKAEVAEYEQKLAAAQERLTSAVAEEQERLRTARPDAADLYVTALLPGKRLWERRRHDPDFLDLRVGTADLPSSVKLSGARTENEFSVHAVPVGFSLRDDGVVGIAGPDAVIDATTRWLVVQLATLHAPRDLTMSFLTSRGGEEWSWLGWVPHLRPDDPDSVVAMIGLDADTLTAQVAGLNQMVAQRRTFLTANHASADSFPAHVVVLHGYRGMRAVPGLTELLAKGPEVAVYAVCVDDHERSLPERCSATFQVDDDTPARGTLRAGGQAPVEGLLREGVEAAWADRVARAVSSLRDSGASQEGESLPDSARLLDVLGIDPPTSDAVRAGWVIRPQSTEMVLGVGMTGPFSLDLKADGPHGLIAGMTGSGKTELLQTIVASLAVANRPDAINFVLVDYKGDSAFKDCVKLPHTVGKVNDLDQHLVVRALASLKAELHYREHFLADAAVKDIEDYQMLRAKEPHRPPLPRLLIVIDEFAQLYKELPEFVNGLVSISQLGRSLGIHLLLATQRPSGVVSPEIRANTNMRIALRVGDAGDSTDVIDAPDASRIAKSTPGRAYARLGAGALQPFQSGRVGGRRPGAVVTDLPPPFVARLGWKSLAYAAPQPPKGKQAEVAVDETDLAALVAAVVEAAEAEQVPAQRSPWLPPMATALVMPEQPAPVPGRLRAFPFGVSDLPAAQRQAVADLDLDRDGHLLVVGAARSGRSQVLRTIAASIAMGADPGDVHLYGLDCGNGALNILTSLPHTGSVVSRTEAERAGRILARIGEEMDARQRLLSAGGFGDITEQRAGSAQPLPHVVLLLDRWESFSVTLGEVDANLDVIMRILREGASLGVHAIISGDRTLAYNTRVSSMTESRLTLRLADKDDYGLVGLNPRQMPDDVPDGRGFRADGAETQVYLLGPDASAQGQAGIIAAIGERALADAAPGGAAPFRVDQLPGRIDRDEVLALVRSGAGPVAAVGVGGDELTPFVVGLDDGTSFVVAGPGRSGRSTVLAEMARSWIATGGQVLAMAPRPGAVRDLAGLDGVLDVLTSDVPERHVAKLVDDASRPLLVVVDDAEGLRMADAGDHFVTIARGAVPEARLAVAGDVDSLSSVSVGWLGEAKKSRRGLLLCPQSYGDGDAVGLRVPRSMIGGAIQPGRGWLHAGDGQFVQVATVAPRI